LKKVLNTLLDFCSIDFKYLYIDLEFAEIILPLYVKGTFTYKVPQDIAHQIEPGMRVLVPFGGK